MTTRDNGTECLVDTARLRGLSAFPRTQVLLGELITDQKLIPSGSQDIQGLDALPSTLKSSLRKAQGDGWAWCAWSFGGEVRAVTGRIDDVSSRMHAKPVLGVLLYDAKGRVIGSSKWLEVRPNQWTACDS